MAVTRSHGRQRGLFLFGMMLVGSGGWLLVRLVMVFAVGMLGQNAPAFNGPMLWRIVGGGTLIAVGFTAMAYSSAAGENWSVDFEVPQPTHSAERELPPTSTDSHREPCGPPRPLIVHRCPNCRTLNEHSHSVCVRCGGLL